MLERQIAQLVNRVQKFRDMDAARELGTLLTRCNRVRFQGTGVCTLDDVVSYANKTPTKELVSLAWALALAKNKLPHLNAEAFSYSDIDNLPLLNVTKKAIITYRNYHYDLTYQYQQYLAGSVAATLYWDGKSWVDPEFRGTPGRRGYRAWRRFRYQKYHSDPPTYDVSLWEFLEFMHDATLYTNGAIRARGADILEQLYEEARERLYELHLAEYLMHFRGVRPTEGRTFPWARLASRENPRWEEGVNENVPRFINVYADTGQGDFQCTIEMDISDMNIPMFSSIDQEGKKLLRSWSKMV